MNKGMIQVFSGNGRGKSSAALGKAIRTAALGENAVIIQFLKGGNAGDSAFLQRMEPEIKFFNFEKSPENFCDLPEEKKKEEISNIRNALNFAKKVLTTGECRLLILDEVLGLIDNQIITLEDLKALLESKGEETGVILTGISCGPEICALADQVNHIEIIK